MPGPEVLDNLSGNYALKTVIGPETHYSTAVVKEIADGQFQIARITVYGPVLYSFKLNGAAVQSPELGSGEVRYKADIKKITIHFEKENSICELSR